MKMLVYWVVMTCELVGRDQCFKEHAASIFIRPASPHGVTTQKTDISNFFPCSVCLIYFTTGSRFLANRVFYIYVVFVVYFSMKWLLSLVVYELE
jgi:hypothetical protein